MLHMTVGIFGNNEPAQALLKKLGKAGTINDIAIYNHGSSEGVFTYVSPNSDKIQTLLQTLNMAEIPAIVISEITAALGEQLIAISEFGFETGFMILDGTSREQIMPLVKDTCIEKFAIVKDGTELVEQLKKLSLKRGDSPLVQIDNYFNVKSVGTVILGIMKSGSLKKYDKVMIQPLEKEVMIKGIQSQDKDFEQTEPGMRVGLNLKGIEADELRRGYVIGSLDKLKIFRLSLQKSRYSKEQLRENDTVFLSAGLQVAAARVKKTGDVLELECEQQLCYSRDTKFLVATTKQALPRIIGHATLLE